MKPSPQRSGGKVSRAAQTEQARKGRAKSNGRAAAKTAGDGFSILQVELDDPTFQRVKREAKRLGVTPGEFCEAATAENLRKMGVEVPDNVLSTGARRAIALVESANTHGSAAATAVQEAGGAGSDLSKSELVELDVDLPAGLAGELNVVAERFGTSVQSMVVVTVFRYLKSELNNIDTTWLTPETRRVAEKMEKVDELYEKVRDWEAPDRLAEVLGLDANETKALGLIAEWEREPLAKYCRMGLDLLERSSLDQMQMVVADKTEGKEERAVAKRYLAKVKGLMPPEKRRAA